MRIQRIKKLNQELLNLKFEDLRNKALMGELEELRMILVDIFSMFKFNRKPFVLKSSQKKLKKK